MKQEYFIERELLPQGSLLDLNEVIGQLVFNERGLIPVITQEADIRQCVVSIRSSIP